MPVSWHVPGLSRRGMRVDALRRKVTIYRKHATARAAFQAEDERRESRDRQSGTIVSGDWRAPFVAGDTIVSDGERIALVGTAACRRGRERRRGDRCRRHDGDTGPHRFACARHLRRLHAAAAHGRLSGKLHSRRHHHGDFGLGGARAGAAERSGGRQGAGAGGAALFRDVPAWRHARARRFGDPRARTQGRRLRRACGQRRPARQGRLRRGEDAVTITCRSCATPRRPA